MATRASVSLAIIFALFFVGIIAVAYFPAFMDVANNDTEALHELNEGDQVTITKGLSMTLINGASSQAEIQVYDRVALEREIKQINENDSATYQLPTDNITVTVAHSDSGVADIKVVYPRDFGFSDNQKFLANNIPLIVLLLTIFLFLSFIAGVIWYDA